MVVASLLLIVIGRSHQIGDAGDWAQTLPVVVGGSHNDIIAATLQHSTFWRDATVLKLSTDMRLSRAGMDAAARQEVSNFAQWLHTVGTGVNNDQTGYITIPPPVRVMTAPMPGVDAIGDPDDLLIQHTYGNLRDNLPATLDEMISFFSGRAILAGKNTDVVAINAKILELLPVEPVTYRSADSIPGQTDNLEDGEQIPVEVLNAMNFPGMALHLTTVKVRALIILFRNIDPSRGLMNGTPLIVTQAGNRVEAKVITGDHRGDTVLIPRLALDHEDRNGASRVRRLQFPTKLVFALTINKSQGQSLDVVGVDLRKEVFGHGQLYVALSRATDASRIGVLLPDDEHGRQRKAFNKVYPQIRQD